MATKGTKITVRFSKKVKKRYQRLWVELIIFLKNKRITVSPRARYFIARVNSKEELNALLQEITLFLKGKTNGQVTIFYDEISLELRVTEHH